MKVEFTLKDMNGVELQEGDKVIWCCEDIPMDATPTMFGFGWRMWNNGERIPGKLLFFRTKEQVASISKSAYPSIELMFIADKGDLTWVIECPSEKEDFRHNRLKKG